MPRPTCCRSCPRSAPARCSLSAKAWRCRPGCASRRCRRINCRAAKPRISTVPSATAGHDMHFVGAVLERWRGATSHRDVPNDPGLGERRRPRRRRGSTDAAALDGPRSRPLFAAEKAAALNSERRSGHSAVQRFALLRPSAMFRQNRINAVRTGIAPDDPATRQALSDAAIASLPEDIRTRLLALQEKSGFVPNVFLTLAYRPDEFRSVLRLP